MRERGVTVNQNDPAQAYKETQIKTANQIKLIVMLYDGAIRHLNLALDAFAEGFKRYDAINSHIIAAQDILSELSASLDFEKGAQIAKNLFSLYAYMNRQLMEANVKKDSGPITSTKKILTDLREAWADLSTRKGLEEKGGAVTGVNIAG